MFQHSIAIAELCSAIVTETTTSWAAENENETNTTDNTITVRMTSTKETTVSATVSGEPTGDDAGTNRTADSDHNLRRILPVVPAPTNTLERVQLQGRSVAKTQRLSNIRSALSVYASAKALARRGLQGTQRNSKSQPRFYKICL